MSGGGGGVKLNDMPGVNISFGTEVSLRHVDNPHDTNCIGVPSPWPHRGRSVRSVFLLAQYSSIVQYNMVSLYASQKFH